MSQAQAQRATWSVAAVFFVVGLVLSAWFTQIPQFKAELSLSDAQLGAALLCPAAGALLSMQLAGRIAARHGSALLARGSPLGIAAAIALVGASHGLGAFTGGLLLFGVADGLADVSMNAHAVAVETLLGRPILQRMHAAFSLGTIVGAASGWAAIWAHVSPQGFLSGVAAGAAAVALATGSRLLPPSADRAQADTAGGSGGSPPRASTAGGSGGSPPRASRSVLRRSGWSQFVIVLGLLGAGCLLAESAAQSWGAVFLRDQRHADPALASAAYFVFTAMQLGGRLFGDRLHTRIGSVALVRAGATAAAAGLVVELLPGPVGVSIAGIGLYSLGLSVLVPIVFGAVGHGSATDHGSESVTGAVAKFTTLSYAGYLLGPASIGWLAQGIGLTWSLASVLVILGAIGAFASWTGRALPGADQAAVPPPRQIGAAEGVRP